MRRSAGDALSDALEAEPASVDRTRPSLSFGGAPVLVPSRQSGFASAHPPDTTPDQVLVGNIQGVNIDFRVAPAPTHTNKIGAFGFRLGIVIQACRTAIQNINGVR